MSAICVLVMIKSRPESALEKYIAQHSCQQVCVAVSGGVDSMVCLHACVLLAQKTPNLRVRALYVNHHLSAQADNWAHKISHYCAAHCIAFEVKSIELDDLKTKGIEAAARTARYLALEQHIQPGEFVLTGHHRDDQAETVLLQLCRGTGLLGLGGMKALMPFGRGYLGRPLLGCTRESIVHWAREQSLSWVHDESNDDEHFSRNFLRHKVMPVLSQHWPACVSTIARNANHVRQMQQSIQTWIQEDYQRCIRSKQRLSVVALNALTCDRAGHVIRYWLAQSDVASPNHRHIIQIQHQLLSQKAKATAKVTWADVTLRVYQQHLWLVKPDTSSCSSLSYMLPWPNKKPLTLPGGAGMLLPSVVPEWAWQQPVFVTQRQGGERVQLKNGHSTSLKKYFQSRGTPPWKRHQYYLIVQNNRVIAVSRPCIREII